MTVYYRIACLKPQPSDNNNRITVIWRDPIPPYMQRTYTINQRTLKRFATAEEAKAALDDFTTKNFGYILTDIWFHINRNGRWAMATGATAPAVWPEDEI